MNKLTFLFLFVCLFGLYACSSEDKTENLPVARGAVGEIIVVMDSASWRGPVGQELRNIFMSPMPGLPQDEPMYKLKYTNPSALNNLLRNAKNMIFVTTMEGTSLASRQMRSYFTKESLEKIKNDPDLFYHSRKDEFARGQEILHLFGQNDEALLAKLKDNGRRIRGFFDEVERKRLEQTLYAKEEKGISSSLEKRYGFHIRVPYGYEIAKMEERFVWLRQLGRDEDKSIFITYRDYDEEGLFTTERLLDLRESVAKAHIFDSGDSSLYVTTQRIAPVDTLVLNFKGHYAVRMKGLWKLSDSSLGGPFSSYTLVDEEKNRLYYIEGFVSSPGKDKINLMREVDVILSTFSINETNGN